MSNRGFRNPRLVIAVWSTVTLVSWLSIGWGWFEMNRLGTETTATGLAIGLALAPGIIAPGMLWLAVKGARLVAAMRHGEGVLARWTVPPTEFADFRANNTARNALGAAYRNDWVPPADIPAAGLEIVFRADGVLVGDTYFSLVNTGMFKFAGVQMLPENPLAIEFGTVATTMSNISYVRLHVSRGVLRLPVSRLGRAAAALVLDHFQRVDTRETVVNAGFYKGRIRFGLMAAPICFLMAAGGFALESSPYGDGYETLSMLLAVGGVIFGLGGLVLALVAWHLSRAQHARR